MSIRYIFDGSVEVDGTEVRAWFDKKTSHSAFSLLWDRIFNVRHQKVRYDEKGCKDFYESVVETNERGRHLPHGALDADQLASGFEAIRRKKVELGLPLDCEHLHR